MSQSPTPVQPATVEHLVNVRQLLREGLASDRGRANRFLLMCLALYTLAIYGLSLLTPYLSVIHDANPDDQYNDMTVVMFVGLMIWVAGYMAILSLSRRWVLVSPRFLAVLVELSTSPVTQVDPGKRLCLAHVDEMLMRVESKLKEQFSELKGATVSLASSTEKILHTIN